MKPESFISFKLLLPHKNMNIIATNNIKEINKNGDISNKWLTNEIIENNDGTISIFDNLTSRVIEVTHWRYE